MKPGPAPEPGGTRIWPRRTRAAAMVMLAAVPLVLLAWLFKTPGWGLAAGIALAAYLALTWQDLRRPTRRVVGAMLAIGWAAQLATGAGPEALIRTLSANAVVGVLIVACGLLAVPAASPRYVAELTRLVSGTQGRRPPLGRLALVFWTGHVLGALLNISALSVLLPALGGARARDGRLMRSLHRGFGLAGFWSPFYATVAIVLIAYPGAGWPGLLAATLPIIPAAFLLDMGAALRHGRTALARSVETAVPEDEAPSPSGPRRRGPSLWLAAGGLAALGIGLDMVMPGPTLVWVIVAALAAALIWMIWANGTAATWDRLIRPRLIGPPGMTLQANEIAVFAAAGPLAAGLAAILAPAAGNIAAIADAMPLWLAILAVEFVIFGLSHLGVHPVASILLVAGALPPEVVADREAVFAGASLAGYTLTLLASPFSVTGQVFASLTGASPWNQTVTRNIGYALLLALLAAFWLDLGAMALIGAIG